ncbi:MAG: phytochrome sensor protein [Rhodocyclales bacterium RIFCSPLOWO2_02_FULL_63_24]|nr:MAG: phytochrome sensor protein [Rhodocyclales bacterium GWA2_65_19]OHC69185.1 MAG: phytochrome sensor protein [Rhodocyclales bacterium RIFCSPLOWO2_02_FULL_63_24]
MVRGQAKRINGPRLPADETPSADILDSWARCVEAGLDAAAVPRLPVVAEGELKRRRERADYVRRLALAELETLFHQIAGSNFLLAFADSEGVILDLYADNRFAMSSSGEAIRTGSQWSEHVAGTNGLGTALAAAKSVAVNGPEHFFTRYDAISCTASPIRDAAGAIVGVLDASSYFESRQRHTQALVQMASAHIENLLLLHQMETAIVLAIHPRPEFLGTISAGLLAFDAGGRLCACNERARILLTGLPVRRGAAFEQIFAERCGRFLARLQSGADIRLHDVLGSSLVTRWVNRGPAVSAARPVVAVPGPTTTVAPNFVADDPAVRDVLEVAAAAVKLGSPLLIQGETGSGKELLARHAHELSGRKGAFVAINCGALPHGLFEAELFGYVGGAFTGARREGCQGLIVSADGGTLMLDEVGELPLSVQAALLRFLDDQMVRPVGSQKARQVNVQLVAATNANLDGEVARKAFRADLLYRLNTIRVDLPPLRRRLDFAACVHFALAAIDPQASITAAAVSYLKGHGWPGNFRELRSVLTRALMAQPMRCIDLAQITSLIAVTRGGGGGGDGSALRQGATEAVLREFERTGRSVSRTSRNLGVSRTTVYRHLREGKALPAQQPG